MPEYKLVLCDVDGTLVTSERRFLADTKRAVRALTEKGVPFVIASGRTPLAIEPLLTELGVETPYIASNGGYVCGADGNVLVEQGFTLDQARDIRAAVSAFCPDAECMTYCGKLWISDQADSDAVRYEKRTAQMDPLVGPVEQFAAPDALIQKLLYVDPRPDMAFIRDYLKQQFPSLEIFLTYENFMEILPAGVTKAYGAGELCRMLGVEPKETVMFGDGHNDLELLAFSGLPVAMGNASDEVKSAARLVISTHNDNGIAATLNDLFDLGLTLTGD